MTSVLLRLIRSSGGERAVAQLLELAEIKREPSYLENVDNWISLDEATAMFEALAAAESPEQFHREGRHPFGLASPRDAATGQATGKRQHHPVTIVKAWGAASPQGLTACAANEDLTEVAVEMVSTRLRLFNLPGTVLQMDAERRLETLGPLFRAR